MNISRFVGATSREALRQVRLALGPDALIVSNKRVNGGVEILAADQTAVAVADAEGAQAAPTRPARVLPEAVSAPPEASSGLLGVIGDLKGSLEARMDELLWGRQLQRSPQAVGLFQTLLRFGFSTALLRAMITRMPDQSSPRAALQWARDELVGHLPVLASEDALWTPGLVLALVGPTGVGKTTTLAKLAARCVRRVGPDRLVLLTTDTYRIGAHEQLKIYGQMLRVPVHVVQDVQELRRILQTVRADQMVLIDNVGISQRDRYVAEQAALLAGAGRPVDRLLVLNASSQGDTLDEVARIYTNDGGTPLKGCIVTKVDEASCLGAALDTALRFRLPIHYVSNGQKVPENLLLRSAADLVDRALAPVGSHRALYSPTQADMAALLSLAQPVEKADEAAEHRRQQALLPLLLTHAAGGEPLTQAQLQKAVDGLDEDVLLSHAYESWRRRMAGDLSTADEVLAASRPQEIPEIAADAVRGLVVHDRWAVCVGGRRGAWSGAFRFDEDGLPLAAEVQQLGFPDGWYSTAGGLPQVPSAAEVWQAQVAASAQAAPNGCHVLASAGASLLRALESSGHAWLSPCAAHARVCESDGVSMASAVTRQLGFHPVDPGAFSGVQMPVPGSAPAVAWWQGSKEVELRTRGVPPLRVRLYGLRAVDPVGGRVLHTWQALGSHARPLDDTQLVRALASWSSLRTQRRVLADLLARDCGEEPLVDRALYCAQLGFAAWHLWQSPALAPVAEVATRMLGTANLPLRRACAGLLKLFALKELLAAKA